MTGSTFTALASVPVDGEAGTKRLVGLAQGDQTIVVAKQREGRPDAAELELSIEVCDAIELAQQCLAGDRRALTSPGLARKLAATVTVLAQAGLAAGTISRGA